MADTTAYKPGGHSDLSPYIMVKDAAAVVTFLTKVFDATILLLHNRPDGFLMHGELGIGDSVVMLSQGTSENPAFPVWMHLYVPDVDATYKRALEQGAPSVQAPMRKEDPDRRGRVKDPSGNIWWISTMETPAPH